MDKKQSSVPCDLTSGLLHRRAGGAEAGAVGRGHGEDVALAAVQALQDAGGRRHLAAQPLAVGAHRQGRVERGRGAAVPGQSGVVGGAVHRNRQLRGLAGHWGGQRDRGTVILDVAVYLYFFLLYDFIQILLVILTVTEQRM